MALLQTIRSRLNRWLILRAVGVALSIVTMIMLLSCLPLTENDSYYWGDGLGSVYLCLPLAGNCWTILYSGIIVVLCLLGNRYHPGIDIALDFIGWGLNWSMGILLMIWAGDLFYVENACDETYGYDPDECWKARKITGIEITAGILTIIVGAFHLAHFVKACVDVHHIRISEQRSKFMELGGMHRA